MNQPSRAFAALFAAALLVIGAGALARPDIATSAPEATIGPTPVTLTVRNPFDGSGETIVSSTMPGCPSGTVQTVAQPDQLLGGFLWIFAGSKTFTSPTGDTFTIAYTAYRLGDASTDSGWWRITGGTGMYAAMKGGGVVRGEYFYDEAVPPNRAGIVDTYTGLVRL